MNASRKIARWVLAFISSLLLFSLLSLVCVKATLFNQEFMVDQIHQTNYVTRVQNDITQRIQDYGRGSNIPPEQLADVVPAEVVAENVDNYIRGIYTGVPFNIVGQETLEGNIQTAVERYAAEQGIDIDEAAQTNIDQLNATAAGAFESYVAIPYLLEYGQKVMAYNQTLTLLMIIVGVAFLLVFIGLMVTSRWLHRKVRFAAVAVGGAGLMLTVLPLYIYFSGVIDRLGIMSEGMYHFITSYLKAFDLTFVKAGIISLVVAILLIVVSEFLRRKNVSRLKGE
ncbi:hypothetical protein [Enterococcus sp. AZ109]|uniref:hypothetical protein n=1 Tax=Enterococcus sp. AZ109 TaxID=2774634 RepID=UPI003F2619C3